MRQARAEKHGTAAGLLVLAALAGAAAGGAADRKLHLLAKAPTYRVGDRIVCKTTERFADMAARRADGLVVRDAARSRSEHLVLEALEVDAAGSVQAFRVSIVQALHSGQVAVPRSMASKGSARIEKLHFVVRRKGEGFEADTTSVVGEKDAELRASQVCLLKSYLADKSDLGAVWTSRACPLPAEAVPVGHTWEPTRQEVEAMLGGPLALGKDDKPTVEAKGTFASLAGNVATVRFALKIRKGTADEPVAFTIGTTARIDTRTGVQVALDHEFELKSQVGELAFKSTSRRQGTMALQRGQGKPTPLPEKLHPLGWQRPGEDTNTYRDETFGFSLTPPEGYGPEKSEAEGGLIARFQGKPDRTILVGYEEGLGIVDLEDLAGRLKGEIKASIRDFKLTEERKATMADNVPGYLIVGTAFGDKACKQVLAVLDGGRLFTLVATCPADAPEERQQAQKALMTFRLVPPKELKAP